MPASNIPGWQLGYRFNAANYANSEFADLTGNNNPLEVLNGSPVFETVDAHECVKLDNTWNARFWHPNVWQGTVVLVARLDRVSGGTLVRYPIGFARDGSNGSSNRLVALFVGNDRRVQLTSGGNVTAGPANLSDSVIGTLVLCQDQIRQNTYWTLDGVAVNSGTAATGIINGNRHQMGSNADGAHLGALFGDVSNTTPDSAVNIHLFEMHFFEANPIEDAAMELQEFLAELSGKYA